MSESWAIGRFATEVLPYEQRTLQFAATALGISLLSALMTVIVGRTWLKARLLSDPLLILLYSLPPFATVIVATALKFEDESVPFMAAAAVIYPLSVMFSEALDEGESFARGCYVGRRRWKLLRIILPAAVPEVLAAIGTCLPWLLLATMLAELAMAVHGGMGIRLMNEAQKGSAAPIIMGVVTVSVVLYGVFAVLARMGRKRLHLNTDVSSIRIATLNPYSSVWEAFIEVLILVIAIVALWLALHHYAPVLIQSPQRIYLLMINGADELVYGVILTLIVTLLSLLVGGGLGFLAAIVAKGFPRWSGLVVVPFLPLQIIPLIVFVPWLLDWRLSLEDQMSVAAAHPLHGILGIIPAALPSLIVATLAAAYAFYEVGRSQLSRIPIGRGAFIAARSPANLQIWMYVDVPWLLRSTWEALSVAMPRTLLAVLVTEMLVTSAGLGGYLADQRGRSNFAQAWGALLLLLGLVVLLRFITNPVIARSLNIWRSG